MIKTISIWYNNAKKVRKELNNGEWMVCPYPNLKNAHTLVKKEVIGCKNVNEWGYEDYDKTLLLWVPTGVWFLRFYRGAEDAGIRFGFFKFWVWYCSPIRKMLKEFKKQQQHKI